MDYSSPRRPAWHVKRNQAVGAAILTVALVAGVVLLIIAEHKSSSSARAMLLVLAYLFAWFPGLFLIVLLTTGLGRIIGQLDVALFPGAGTRRRDQRIQNLAERSWQRKYGHGFDNGEEWTRAILELPPPDKSRRPSMEDVEDGIRERRDLPKKKR